MQMQFAIVSRKQFKSQQMWMDGWEGVVGNPQKGIWFVLSVVWQLLHII